MFRRFRRGLVVGKFSPLHHGHELLIRHAQSACDEVAVISYSKPEFPRCEAAVRCRWLADLFPAVTRLVIDDARLASVCVERGLQPLNVPHNDAPEDEHRRFCAWLCQAVLGMTMDAVFTSEAYGDGFAAVLGECFSATTGSPHAVTHVCVDLPRLARPVSGTRLRAAPHDGRAFMSPVVYADFVERICLLGGESTGKTTLAEALAARLGTAWVPEYGRELWVRKGGALEYADMLAIGRRQVALEEAGLLAAAERPSRWLACDTSPLTTAFYCEAMFGRLEAELADLAGRFYDHVWLCAPDFDFVQDGTRRDAAFRDRQHDWYCSELARRGIGYSVLRGDLDSRLKQALALLHGKEP